jgi:KUP system potassium uptake protein
MKHNKVLHERVIIITVAIGDVPYVDREDRIEVHDLGKDFWRIILHYGFMQEIDVPAELALVAQCGPAFKPMDTASSSAARP